MMLFHYTSLFHLPLIERAGFIGTTESNLSLRRQHAGPPVVWLTSSADWEAHGWHRVHGMPAGEDIPDKLAARIVVSLPDGEVERWTGWARRRAVPERVRRALTAGQPGWTAWHVIERAIPRTEWLEVHRRDDPATWSGYTDRLHATDERDTDG